HAPDKTARFVHESRMFTDNYGSMRFATHPANASFHAWSVDYHKRQLAQNSLAAGFFMDNSGGKAPVKQTDVQEPVGEYAPQHGELLAAVEKGIAPAWILANTAAGANGADPVIKANPAYFEEFAIRPLYHTWHSLDQLSTLVAHRASLTKPAPL